MLYSFDKLPVILKGQIFNNVDYTVIHMTVKKAWPWPLSIRCYLLLLSPLLLFQSQFDWRTIITLLFLNSGCDVQHWWPWEVWPLANLSLKILILAQGMTRWPCIFNSSRFCLDNDCMTRNKRKFRSVTVTGFSRSHVTPLFETLMRNCNTAYCKILLRHFFPAMWVF